MYISYKDTCATIMQAIKVHVDQGKKEFILYPFGVNGMLAKNILQEQFGIEPSYILDNKLCKSNDEIHSIDFLEQLDIEKYVILLTIENPLYYDDVRVPLYKYMGSGYVVELFEHYDLSDGRVDWIRDFSKFVYERGLEGNVAECGVYRGDLARFINVFFKDKKCYLFDSFEGFKASDIDEDIKLNPVSSFWDKENLLNFTVTSMDYVLSRMPFPNQIETRKGYIPETLRGIEDEFCFVNLDMDLYHPMLEALKFFYPRMVDGGVILLHDYFSPDLIGVEKAVRDFEQCLGMYVCKMPMRVIGSLAIIKN